jgi:acetoacetyl-CoA synthetase
MVPMHMDAPEELWTPDPAVARVSAMAQFARFVGEQRLAEVDELDYASLHAWSVNDLEEFWAAAAQFLGVRFHAAPQATLGSLAMPGAEWFPGAMMSLWCSSERTGWNGWSAMASCVILLAGCAPAWYALA